MTTRNEWIAETARIGFTHGFQGKTGRMAYEDFDNAIIGAKNAADALESANVAPWQPAPAQDDGEAVALLGGYLGWVDSSENEFDALDGIQQSMRAYLARLDAAKGGAK